MKKHESVAFIPQEMREASAASFPLSPGIMDCHYIFSDLYWYLRQNLLKNKTIEEVFGTSNPVPPKLTVPHGHRQINTEGLSSIVWDRFLATSFKNRPEIDPVQRIRDLITANVTADTKNFEERMSGLKSQLASGKAAPSLVRTFAFEKRFPLYKDNEFFNWVLTQIAHEIVKAHNNNFEESWSNGLKGLVLLWNAKFPEDPFVPEPKK